MENARLAESKPSAGPTPPEVKAALEVKNPPPRATGKSTKLEFDATQFYSTGSSYTSSGAFTIRDAIERACRAAGLEPPEHAPAPGRWVRCELTCPYCGKTHTHGGGDGPVPDGGHRGAHCLNPPRGGYIVEVAAEYQKGGQHDDLC